jgi:2-keto-4-pentenoate hydratase/2-oxohepta-3-ene-1,7-dioic acid hydratase in catechol pathway
MRIVRFSFADCKVRYGVVEDDPEPISVTELSGNPFKGAVEVLSRSYWLAEVRLFAPTSPTKVVGVGRNYADHVAEMGSEVPPVPALFLKPSTAVIGHGESIVKPAATTNLHYEGELAVVIGRSCHRVNVSDVGAYIYGFTVANDVTARDLQQSDIQWTRAKGWDTFCPLGPWIETALTLEQAGQLALRTTVDGVIKQDGNTSEMIRGIADLVSYVSSFTTLLPGDVILTGTPSGVGSLEPGQSVSIEIAGIGVLRNPVTAES